MTGIFLRASADVIADEFAAVLGPDAPWVPTPAWVEAVLAQPTRCSECQRPLHRASSVAAGMGPVCRAKRGRR